MTHSQALAIATNSYSQPTVEDKTSEFPFEKWQSLGNDYLILEQAKLPFELTTEIVKALCDRHCGIGSDGIVEVSAPTERGYIAKLRIFNPDGGEAELSGNGVRQACLYLRKTGWSDTDNFSIQTKAGEIRATILDNNRCQVDMGRAKLSSPSFPSGGQDGIGELSAGGRNWRFQHVSVGNPQCAIRVQPDELTELRLPDLGPEIEHSPLFPERTNVSFWGEVSPGKIQARIFERGVGETLSSGTGACGAAIAYVVRGGDSPVTVQLDGGTLEVTVDEALQVYLTGPANHVYRGSAPTALLSAIT